MYNIKTLNKISDVGLSKFGKDKYVYGDNVENPDAVMVRSASMHDMEMPKSLLAIARAGAGVNNIPVDGSEKLADDLMESIEPFHFDEAVDFETAYLAGYLADKYDVDEAASESRANERI